MLPVAVGTTKQAISLDNLAHPAFLAHPVVVVDQGHQAAAADQVNPEPLARVVVVASAVVLVLLHLVVLVLRDNQADQVNPDNQGHQAVEVQADSLDNQEHLEMQALRDNQDNRDNQEDLEALGVKMRLVVLLAVKVVALLMVISMKLFPTAEILE